MTYPDTAVDADLTGGFAGLKINLLEKHPDFKEAAGGVPVPWAPTLRFTDAKGREVRRTIGWLSPIDFRGELRLVRGLGELGRYRFDEALALLESVVEEFPETPAAPEAFYYTGAAVFIRGKRDMSALAERWNALRDRYPQSDWATKASVVEDLG